MKNERKLIRPVAGLALVTVLVLLIPFLGMQFSQEVNWSPADFAVMGVLVFGSGLAGLLLYRRAPNTWFRLATLLALGTILLLTWTNLAVGLIGSGPNAGNLMYGGVVLIAVMAIVLSRLQSAGMERAMYVSAAALLLLTLIALGTGMQHYPGSSVKEIVGVGGFFMVLFGISGIAFRFAGSKSRVQQAS